MDDTLRIDKMLWYLRLCKSRNIAQNWIGEGHIRINGGRVLRSSHLVRIGDIITVPSGESAMAIIVQEMPLRRDSPVKAAGYYTRLPE